MGEGACPHAKAQPANAARDAHTCELGQSRIDTVGVHASYFEYEAGTKALLSAREAAKISVTAPAASSENQEMVDFLTSQGLTGPTRAYAQTFALEGIRDPIALVTL